MWDFGSVFEGRRFGYRSHCDISCKLIALYWNCSMWLEDRPHRSFYKSGGHESMDNYRPISILPVNYVQSYGESCQRSITKVPTEVWPFESISARIRQHHSAESAMIYFTDEIRRSAESGKLTGAFFIDLRKAFDSMPHKELLSKLKRFGFGEN